MGLLVVNYNYYNRMIPQSKYNGFIAVQPVYGKRFLKLDLSSDKMVLSGDGFRAVPASNRVKQAVAVEQNYLRGVTSTGTAVWRARPVIGSYRWSSGIRR